MSVPLDLRFPFTGWWLARNSPARRVPSHGSHLLGTTHAIDFIGLSDAGRHAPWSWRTALGTEPADAFPSFGRPLLAPVAGTVVQAWDDEPDHIARRSQLHLVPYVLGQHRRYRDGGVRAITGNAVVIRVGQAGPYVASVTSSRGACWWRRVTRWAPATRWGPAATPATPPNPTCTSR